MLNGISLPRTRQSSHLRGMSAPGESATRAGTGGSTTSDDPDPPPSTSGTTPSATAGVPFTREQLAWLEMRFPRQPVERQPDTPAPPGGEWYMPRILIVVFSWPGHGGGVMSRQAQFTTRAARSHRVRMREAAGPPVDTPRAQLCRARGRRPSSLPCRSRARRPPPPECIAATASRRSIGRRRAKHTLDAEAATSGSTAPAHMHTVRRPLPPRLSRHHHAGPARNTGPPPRSRTEELIRTRVPSHYTRLPPPPPLLGGRSVFSPTRPSGSAGSRLGELPTPSELPSTIPHFTPSGGSGTGLDVLASAALSANPGNDLAPPTSTGLATPKDKLAGPHTPGPYNPAASLPPKVVKKILALEFVEMAELRADVWPEDTSPADSPTAPRRSSRPPVTKIKTWLECYARLAAVLVTRFPEKAPELWAYQSTIVKAAHSYEGATWVAYDRQYRRQMLARKDLNWSVPDSRLYNEAFTGRARAVPRCQHCISEEHDSSSCPQNPNPPSWAGSTPLRPRCNRRAWRAPPRLGARLE